MKNPVRELSHYLQFIRDAKVVFSSPQGQRVLSYLMKKGCVTVPVASSDRDESLRNEGMQRLVLSILKASKQNESQIEEQLLNEYES